MPGLLPCNTLLFAPCWWAVKTVHGNVTVRFVTVPSEWKQVVVTCKSPSLPTSSLLCCSSQLMASSQLLPALSHSLLNRVLWVLWVSPVGWKMEFRLSLLWYCDNQLQGSSMWKSPVPSMSTGGETAQTHRGNGYWFLQWKTFCYNLILCHCVQV